MVLWQTRKLLHLSITSSYLERDGSSLIYMTEKLIEKSKHPKSGFYLHNIDELAEQLIELEKKTRKNLTYWCFFALLDLFEKHQFQLKHTTIMETGGMKGQRKELTREELHQLIKKASGVNNIHSEYGMTELLSQAYAKNDGLYSTPPWMKIIIKDINDPFQSLANSKPSDKHYRPCQYRFVLFYCYTRFRQGKRPGSV